MRKHLGTLVRRFAGGFTKSSVGARLQAARPALSVVLLLAANALFLRVLHPFHPVGDWLVWTYLLAWLCGAWLCLACHGAGLWALGLIVPGGLRSGQRRVVGFALGVLLFCWVTFLAGFAGLLGHGAFFAIPSLLILLGHRALLSEAKHARRLWSAFGWRLLCPRTGVQMLAATVLGLGLLGLYVLVITPHNVGYDALWYHFGMAEHYAASGAITRFAEGWFPGAYPQLASILYTWTFLAPASSVYVRAMLAMHVEWFLFLCTLAALPVLVRMLVGRRLSPYSAAALFLFPGIFLYDSNLVGYADHVLAFWATPIAICFFRFWRAPTWRFGTLLGLCAAGALLTKYQGIQLLGGIGVALALGALRQRSLALIAAPALSGLVATSVHWARNLVWYHDPLYPFLHRYLPSSPAHSELSQALYMHYWGVSSFVAHGSPLERAWQALKVLPTFSFIPHEWPSFHGAVPVFGSLFTLLTPLVFVLKLGGRARALLGLCYAGLFVWFHYLHFDRFLQCLVPWMTAVTAAVLYRAWANGWLYRGLVAPLLAVQLVWGAGAYFYGKRNGLLPISLFVEHIAAGMDPAQRSFRRRIGGLQDVEPLLAPHAKVLSHHFNEKLGLGRPSISDGFGWQGGINYLDLTSLSEFHAFLWTEGVTDIIYHDRAPIAFSLRWLAREAVFSAFVRRHTGMPRRAGSYVIAPLHPFQPRPAGPAPLLIGLLDCRGSPSGVYTPRGLAVGRPSIVYANPPSEIRFAPKSVDVVISRNSCLKPRLPVHARRIRGAGYKKIMTVSDLEFWARP